MTAIIDRYAISRRKYEGARRYLSGGVSSMLRASCRPVPLFFRHAHGSRMTDVDGNQYIDYSLAWGPLILGHSHPDIIKSVRTQLKAFQLIGAQHDLETKVAQKICELVPCAEMVAFSNTGSEAVQLGLRLAKAYTRRPKFIKFEGHYHGWIDSVLMSYHPNITKGDAYIPMPASAGQSDSVQHDIIILPWNDLTAVETTLAASHSEIAAIIMEPILCNSGCLMPRPGFLEGVRQSADRYGIVLIFDEVITGFRVAPGGAQELFSVTPDLVVLGKAIASGFPLSAVAGKKAILDLIAEGTVVHAGTFNGNPIALAASHATLNCITKPELARLRASGETLMRGILQLADRVGLPVLINGVGSVFHLSFTSVKTMNNYRDSLECDTSARDRFIDGMLGRGVYLLPDGRWYISTAHTDIDVRRTLEATSKVFATLVSSQ